MNNSYKVVESLLMGIILIAGCKKETTKNVSKIYTVPFITVKGSEAISISVGGTYTEAGADYTGEDGKVTTIQPSSGTVDASQPGLYLIHYTKTSASGIYESEAVRFVAVTSVNDPVDWSGTYNRPATGIDCFVQKVANGVY